MLALIVSDADLPDFPRSYLRDSIQQAGTKGTRSSIALLRAIRTMMPSGDPRGFLLELQIPVGGDEDFEPVRCGPAQQLAIGQPGPALLLNRANVMTPQLASQLARQLLIEQNAHAR